MTCLSMGQAKRFDHTCVQRVKSRPPKGRDWEQRRDNLWENGGGGGIPQTGQHLSQLTQPRPRPISDLRCVVTLETIASTVV